MLEVGVLVIIFGLVFTLLISGFYTVPHEERWVIELFRKYYTTWESGWHILIPGVMTVRNKVALYDQSIELDLRSVDFSDDSAPVKVRVIVRIVNPYLVTYKVSNWQELLRDRLTNEVRATLGGNTFDESARQPKIIAAEIEERIEKYLKEWGLMLQSDGVLVLDIKASPETVAFRRETQKAKRQKQVIITLAEGESESQVIKARGESQAQVLLGRGQMGKIKEIASGLNITPEQVIAFLLTGKLYDSLQSSTIIATSEGGTLNIPAVTAAMSAISKAMKK